MAGFGGVATADGGGVAGALAADSAGAVALLAPALSEPPEEVDVPPDGHPVRDATQTEAKQTALTLNKPLCMFVPRALAAARAGEVSHDASIRGRLSE
jgi:hypothetical protein